MSAFEIYSYVTLKTSGSGVALAPGHTHRFSGFRISQGFCSTHRFYTPRELGEKGTTNLTGRSVFANGPGEVLSGHGVPIVTVAVGGEGASTTSLSRAQATASTAGGPSAPRPRLRGSAVGLVLFSAAWSSLRRPELTVFRANTEGQPGADRGCAITASGHSSTVPPGYLSQAPRQTFIYA